MRKELTYAKHGMKKPLGQLVVINGKRAVAFVDNNNQIMAYTTLDELNDMFCKKGDLPELLLNF